MKKFLGAVAILFFLFAAFAAREFVLKKKEVDAFNFHVDEFNACSDSKHWTCAETHLKFLLKELPKDTNLRIHYAGILFEQGRYEECISYIQDQNFQNSDLNFLLQKSKLLIRERDELGIRDYGHFRLELEGYASPIEVQEALSVLEVAYDSIANLFQFYSEDRIHVVMYQTENFQGVGEHPDWVAATYDGKLRIPANLMQYRNVYRPILFHELTHAFVHQMTRAKVPLWLNEGIAQIIDGSHQGVPQPNGPVPSLEDLTESFTKQKDRAKAERLYWYSQKMTEALLEDAGEHRFEKLRDALKDMKKLGIDESLNRHFCKKQGDILYNFVVRK